MGVLPVRQLQMGLLQVLFQQFMFPDKGLHLLLGVQLEVIEKNKVRFVMNGFGQFY